MEIGFFETIGKKEDINIMEDIKGKNWIELCRYRDNLEGRKILEMLKRLGSSVSILVVNYRELIKMINNYESDKLIWIVENRHKLDILRQEVIRLLHNYLASIASLIDHTRVFCKHISNSEFDACYKLELNELNSNKCTKFMKDLRNYAQHYNISFVDARLQIEITDTKTHECKLNQTLDLGKEYLLKWDGWTSDSKEYIDRHEEYINLKTAINDYQNLITKFYKWIYDEIHKLYQEQIGEFKKVSLEMQKIESVDFGDLNQNKQQDKLLKT